MTKAELADNVLECIEGDCSQREATDLVESTLAIVKEALSQRDVVKLSGFGRFDTRDKKPRLGRNPQTGEPILIEAHRVVKFTPSAKLRAKLNGGGDGEDTR